MLKRCIDVFLSVLVLLSLSPVLAAVALAVWIDSGSPVLFRQMRMGRAFCQFQILKFRTMRIQCGGSLLTASGDSRVTRVGRFLRITKLDELPQFWNVLRGEMSVVGPRPEVPEHVKFFESRYRDILAVRPGITDLASIHFRHAEDILARSKDALSEYKERVLPMKLALADKYLRERSVLLDLSIIVQTAIAILRPSASSQND